MKNLFRMNMNNNNTASGIRARLIPFAFLIFVGLTTPLSAQSVWSGNASVDAAEFVNFVNDFPLAGASSSFTRSTVIQVTNPQNNKTVNVTIVKRAPKPGVFLVLSEEAGKALSIPEGQVIPVQVQVVNAESSNAYDEFHSSDPDINPAVSVPATEELSGDEAVVAAKTPDAEVPDLDILPGSTEEDLTGPLAGDSPVPVPVPAESLRVERDAPVPDELPVAGTEPPADETVADEIMAEETVVEEPLVDSPVVVIPEPAPAEPEAMDDAEILTDPDDISSLLPSGDNVIYFLTPSDFRPPTGPVDVKEDAEEIVPVLVDRSSLEKFIVNQLKNGSSYIQLGAYSSPESIYDEITAIADRYPMVVWTEAGKNGTLYKLLIGPLTKDETGVLSYRFRSTGYADLFLYKP